MNLKEQFNELDKEEKLTFISNTIVNSIPYIGPLINDLFFELPNKIQQNRINKTVSILKEKFEQIDEKYIVKEYLLSDDFFDFTRNMFETTVKIKSEEKRKILSNIYVEAVINKDDFELSKNRLFINIVTNLSSVQVIILKYIQQFENELHEIEKYEKFYNAFSSKIDEVKLSKYEFKAYCIDIESKGLISMGSGLDDYLAEESSFITSSDHHEPSVLLTDLGKEFLSFLNR